MRAAAQAAIAAVDALEAEEEAGDADLADESDNDSLFGGSSGGCSVDEEEQEDSPAPAAAGQDVDALSVTSMSVAQLKQLLAARGLHTGGNKAALQERLKAAVAAVAGASKSAKMTHTPPVTQVDQIVGSASFLWLAWRMVRTLRVIYAGESSRDRSRRYGYLPRARQVTEVSATVEPAANSRSVATDHGCFG